MVGQKWRFPDNNYTAENGLDTSDMEMFKRDPVSSLAREICQNSIDAAYDKKPVRVEFSLFHVARETIPGVDDLAAQITACYEYKKGSPKEGPALKELKKSIAKPMITCLRVSDFNTTGVEGAKTNARGTPFYNLTKGSGVSDKGGSTGTGKTVISALDYKRFRKQNPDKPCRLLFVAHREEILKQSMYTFRAVLKDANFGEMFVGSYKPESIDNLFISIQTFNSQDFTAKTTPEFYDYIIVDEFHHAAAPTYQKLLAYYQPRILLGLTATPERMDGKSVLPYFNNRIAAEIRLPEAIDRKLLCPFQYFGVTDTVDLDTLKWSAGGYDKGELSKIYTLSGAMANRRADLVVSALLKYVTDIDDVKGLGFCVSIEHAEFMCRYFNEHNIPSVFLTGHSPEEERKTAKQRLVAGEVRFIFVVDAV